MLSSLETPMTPDPDKPRMTNGRLRGLARAIWAAYLVAFALVGLWGYRGLDGYLPQRHSDSLGALETIVEMGLGSSKAGPELVQVLAEAPPGRDVLMFASEMDQTCSALAQGASYLVWPRRLVLTILNGSDRVDSFARTLAASKPGVLLFYRLSVPFKGGREIGPKLIYFRVP